MSHQHSNHKHNHGQHNASQQNPGQHSAPCQHVVLGDCGIGSVSICPDCNVVHLALSHITVRLAPQAFRAMADMVGNAQARLDDLTHASAAAAAAAAATVIDDARHGPKPY